MKISDIKSVQRKPGLNIGVTFVIAAQAKDVLHTIAVSKGRTVSDLVREIVTDFLAKNAEEIKSLSDKTA